MQDKLINLSHPSTGLEDLIQQANDLIRAAKAPSTRKAYQSDFRIFESWCAAHGLASLPSAPQTIALYIASCVVARLAPATITRRLASISKAHQAAGFEDSPASTKHFVVGEVLKGARRTLGIAQNCKDPLLLNDICRLLAACPKNLVGLRDRALILIGFAGAFRRSELCAMTVSDLCFSASGLVISVPRSKADQEQAGEKVAIPFGEHKDTCPIKALRQWLKAANVTEGSVFRGTDRPSAQLPGQRGTVRVAFCGVISARARCSARMQARVSASKPMSGALGRFPGTTSGPGKSPLIKGQTLPPFGRLSTQSRQRRLYRTEIPIKLPVVPCAGPRERASRSHARCRQIPGKEQNESRSNQLDRCSRAQPARLRRCSPRFHQ